MKNTDTLHTSLAHALTLFLSQYAGNGNDEREQRPEIIAARAALAEFHAATAQDSLTEEQRKDITARVGYARQRVAKGGHKDHATPAIALRGRRPNEAEHAFAAQLFAASTLAR